MTYFWCERHHKVETFETRTDECLPVGPYRTREAAEGFGAGSSEQPYRESQERALLRTLERVISYTARFREAGEIVPLLREARKLLASPSEAPREGWKLVPVEIDRETCRPMLDVWNLGAWNNDTLETTWPRLVAAAPGRSEGK
jgi:hypothetical protein